MPQQQHGTATYTLGQYNEVHVALTRALPKALEGTDPKQTIKAMQTGETLEQALHEAIVSFLRSSIASTFSHDMTKQGWTLVEDVVEPEKISVVGLEVVFWSKKDEQVTGEEITNQAKNLGANLGQHHAEYLLEHQQEIPEEWRRYFFVFPGTRWRDCDGAIQVPSLYSSHEQWYLTFSHFPHDRFSGGPLLRPRR